MKARKRKPFIAPKQVRIFAGRTEASECGWAWIITMNDKPYRLVEGFCCEEDAQADLAVNLWAMGKNTDRK